MGFPFDRLFQCSEAYFDPYSEVYYSLSSIMQIEKAPVSCGINILVLWHMTFDRCHNSITEYNSK